MRISSLIGHLGEVLGAIRASPEPADAVVAHYFRSRKYLGARDRRFIADHLYAILRHHRLLEAVASKALGAGIRKAGGQVPPLAIAIAGVVRSGTDLPEHERDALRLIWNVQTAGISWIESFDGLRTAAEDVVSDPDPASRLALLHSMPEFAVREWIDRYGVEEAGALCSSLNESAPTTARVNSLRSTPEECRAALSAAGLEVRPGRFLPEAMIFAKRPAVQTLAPFRSGWFEMQDEGSQLISRFLNPAPGETVLDACAGAGGKTLHCAALMANRGRLVAADVDPRRLGRLRERALRAGASIVEIGPGGRVPDSLRERADAVLVDAPCSGLGTLRRNPGMKPALTEAVSASYAGTQMRILSDSAGFLRPGGRLVYATCTLVRRENEDIVERFLRARNDFTVVPAREALPLNDPSVFTGPYMQLLPGDHGTDGFFAALLLRAG